MYEVHDIVYKNHTTNETKIPITPWFQHVRINKIDKRLPSVIVRNNIKLFMWLYPNSLNFWDRSMILYYF
jgi:hypothetical protein